MKIAFPLVMAGLVWMTWLGPACFSISAQVPQSRAAPETVAAPVRLERATDVLRWWQPQQHLYVKGNVGSSAEGLAALEEWLRAAATNWVVVLAENAENESYTDAEGHAYRGVEAVNQAMGKGLINQTAFGQQTDPRTGERDAAFFMLFLKEHNLSYFGSDAQDRRGLGEDRWKGNLDRPAVAAMRNGARVVDAAKDTIANINRQLEARITAEAEARKRKAAAELAARKEALEEARAAVENARKNYQLLESKSGDLSRSSASFTGDLAQPDLAGLRAELQNARNALDSDDAVRARRAAEYVGSHAQSALKQLDQYGADRQELEGLVARLAEQKRRPYAKNALGQIQTAQLALDQARLQYDRADSSYVLLLRNADTAVNAAEAGISGAELAGARERFLGILLAISSLAALAGIALFLNRRRFPAKKEARELYDLWTHANGEKVNALFGLLDRRATFVGTSADEAGQRYSGETLELARQVIQDVDELFIMSSCAGRVLEQGRGLLQPDGPAAKLANLFLASPYRRCIGLLRDQPIAFKPEEGLELVVRGARTERDRLIGDLKSYEAFTMTFNQLIEAFNLRAQRALAALDQVESTLANAPELLRKIQATLDSLHAREPELAAGAAQNGCFGVRPVFERLIPSAQTALGKAVKMGIADPVGALHTEGAVAGQQTEDARALIELAGDAREALLPVLRERAAALAKSGLSCKWIGAEVTQLSARADQAAINALEHSVETEIAALRQTRADLEERVRKTMELDARRRGQSQQQLARATESVESAREKIGSALRISPDEILCEQDRDPGSLLQQARAQFEAAFAALERGDLEAASNALDAVAALSTQAEAIVTASLEALANQSAAVTELRKEWQRVGELVPAHAKVLAEIQATYAAAVLDLDTNDPAHPEANRTIADNIEETEAHLAAARAALDKAEQVFPQGRVLESAGLLRQGRGRLNTALHRLAEITEKQQRLAAVEAGNRDQLQQIETSARQCAKAVDEPTAMTPTRTAFESASNFLEQARAAVSASPASPFQAAAMLLAARESLAAVADSARCDKDVFDQAGRSLASAQSQLAQAGRVAGQAAGDGTPDSSAIRQALGEINSLGESLNGVRQLYSQAHGDWHKVDDEANQVAQRAAAATATLRGELDRAQAAMAALAAAAGAVRSAGAWTGGFGVAIFGSPGSDRLSQARAFLERGEYESAHREAETARRVAERAVAQAEAELQQRRCEEEQRREAARRQRQAEEESHRWSQSSSPSTFSSSSWGSSGSGVSSSSFSSGSGVSTSSW